MNKHFRLILTLILIVFSIGISFIITIFDYNKLIDQTRTNHEKNIMIAEEKIMASLSTIDKVYDLLDIQLAEVMEEKSIELLRKYETTPQFNQWDFKQLSEQMGMDVFIIDEQNKVTHSSFDLDIGLDFKECCPKFSALLDERRATGGFWHDGMDLQRTSGEIKKFSYIVTPDKRYIIELGRALENDRIFQQFNFLKTIEALEKENSAISSIRIYNSDGYLMSTSTGEEASISVSPSMRKQFEQALKEDTAQEVILTFDDRRVMQRYVPYTASQERGISTTRVVEIIYNDVELSGLLHFYQKELLLQLLVIFAAAIGMSYLIARLISKPVYLAFHDSLTGIKNRAAFEVEMGKLVKQKNDSLALMIIDIDNFKIVNDSSGHREGDRILRQTAQIIQSVVGSKNFAARIGGDEFIVLLTNPREEVEQFAEDILRQIQREISLLMIDEDEKLSVSMGIVFAADEDDSETLYEKADRALYISKMHGKNQFTIYNHM